MSSRSGLSLAVALALTFIGASSRASAQVISDPKKEGDISFARLFLQQPGGNSSIFGAFSLYRSQKLSFRTNAETFFDSESRLVIDLDYGTLRQKRVTATGKVDDKEPDLSTNVGKVTYSLINTKKTTQLEPKEIPTQEPNAFAISFPSYNRYSLSLGVQHTRRPDSKKVGGKDVPDGETQLVAPLLDAAVRRIETLGNRVSNKDAAHDYQGWYTYGTEILTTKAVRRNGDEKYDVIVQPSLQLAWTYGLAPKSDRGDDFGFQWGLFANLGYGFDASLAKDSRAYIDASLVYNITSRAGIELRHFSGFFGNNYRDAKVATELTALIRF